MVFIKGRGGINSPDIVQEFQVFLLGMDDGKDIIPVSIVGFEIFQSVFFVLVRGEAPCNGPCPEVDAEQLAHKRGRIAHIGRQYAGPEYIELYIGPPDLFTILCSQLQQYFVV